MGMAVDEVGQDSEGVLAEGGRDLLVAARGLVVRPVEAGKAGLVAEALMPGPADVGRLRPGVVDRPRQARLDAEARLGGVEGDERRPLSLDQAGVPLRRHRVDLEAGRREAVPQQVDFDRADVGVCRQDVALEVRQGDLLGVDRDDAPPRPGDGERMRRRLTDGSGADQPELTDVDIGCEREST